MIKNWRITEKPQLPPQDKEVTEIHFTMDDKAVRFSSFCNQNPDDMNIVCIDHNYAKLWSAHPDASSAQPLRMLFMDKFPRPENQDKESACSDEIDVVGEAPVSTLPYDVNKARFQMTECDRQASLLFPDQSEMRDDWEENIAAMKASWSVLQSRIFAKVIRVLQADRLARLSIQETKNEPILRRLQVDKAARRVRQAFANAGWDMSLILWIHNLFLEHLRGQLLTSYLEVLQTMKSKIPSLVERLINGTTLNQDILSSESISALLKKSWDPVLASINQQKLKRLPENPLLLVIPNAPSSLSNPLSSKRHKFWYSQMAAMGKVINVIPINSSTNISVANCVENMIATVRSKLLEVKGHYPNRPIVLVGWHIGAVVACHVALMDMVQAVVCLGFPTMGVSGNRWDIEDQIYNIKTSTLFVVGQHASANCLDMLEEVREKLRVETGLVLVGGADDNLRMCRAKKRSCNTTQSMVDRCIMDEMYDFLGSILSKTSIRTADVIEDLEPFKKPRKRKQKDIAAAVTSQTFGALAKQSSHKIAKSLGWSSSGASMFSGQIAMSAAGKIGKRVSPKKKTAKPRNNPTVFGKKHPMQDVVPSSTSQSPPNELSKIGLTPSTEAAFIASAPELSNLLQKIKTSQSESQSNVSTQACTTSVSCSTTSTHSIQSQTPTTSVPGTSLGVASLSRFLSSPAFLKNAGLMKSIDPNAPLSETESSDISNQKQQQSQILIRTGPDSEPLSIPLSYSMASKVLKHSSLMKFGDSSATSHIHKLLTSSTVTSTPTMTSSNFSASQSHSQTVSPSSTTPLASVYSSKSSSSATCEAKSTVLGSSVHSSPGASIINIGNDTVSMKESPPSNIPAPETVSINLGEIAANNNTNILKLSSPSKVSLIPHTVHGLPRTSQEISGIFGGKLSNTEFPLSKHLSPQRKSTENVPKYTHTPVLTSLTESNRSSSLISAKVPTASTLLSSLTSSHVSTTSTQSTSTAPAENTSGRSTISSLSSMTSYPAASTMRSLQLFSSSDHGKNSVSDRVTTGTSTTKVLSTINSSSGLITLQLAPSRKDSSATVVTFTKDHGSTDSKHLVFQKQLYQLRDPAGSKSQDSSLLTGSSSKKETEPKSMLDDVSTCGCATSAKSTIIMTTQANKSKFSQGQIVLQYKNSSSVLSSSQGSKPRSPQLVIATTTETLGQVSSLLESSPITLGDQSRSSSALSSISHVQESKLSLLAKPTERRLSSSSTSSASSHGSMSPKDDDNAPECIRVNKSGLFSYTATPKSVLPTVASTRTRRIKTPKQYDL